MSQRSPATRYFIKRGSRTSASSPMDVRTSLAVASPGSALSLRAVTFWQGVSQANGLATQKTAPKSPTMADDPGTEQRSHPMHDASSRLFSPTSSHMTSTSSRSVTCQQPSPTKAAPAARTVFDPWNSSSTGHQRAENRLSGSTSWRFSRNLKLSEQYKGGLSGGGKRVADTVGAGNEEFGKDGRKPNGEWETGAKRLRTSGQKSLAEVWGVSKAGKKSTQEKRLNSPDEHDSTSQLQGAGSCVKFGTSIRFFT